ncbi:MAG: glycosyltransferase family 2 protein [Porticoccus sp.]|uniref:glycosyltransferase family 2 protein n=1 Tax=Porticoccus sp. TaxID=2024853 RepID=UPI003298D1B0
MKASIVIRTYNEERHLPDLLSGISQQMSTDIEYETILVDSGSTDRTLDIARNYQCHIEHIEKDQFSFGRSLNIGCRAATGDVLVFVSGHCVPATNEWLVKLIEPLNLGQVELTYGKQIGNSASRFSECRIFDKYFPKENQIPQEGFYCNNANSALLTKVWKEFPFDEELTGLEDMYLARKLVGNGMRLGYVADAPVYHIHDETWRRVKNRFEREAIALQHIMPEVHLSFVDFARYFTSSLLFDYGAALQQKVLFKNIGDIFMYRLAQYWGAYRGNHFHRQLSKKRKERYFYPR